jgi:hypothetical protein
MKPAPLDNVAAPCTGDDPLLPAYRILLRIARTHKAQKQGAGPSKPARARDLDQHQPGERQVSCPRKS